MAGPLYKGEDIVCSAWQHAAGYNPGCKVATCIEHTGNTLQSRSGGQLPFSSINYGTCTLPEGRMVTKAILDVSLHGLGQHGQTSIFPCGIFQCAKNISEYPGDPNYDLFKLALKSTAQRLYPNYCNCDWSTDIAGRMLDVKHKKDVISKLSPENLDTLTRWVIDNPEDARNYKLVIKENGLCVDENIVLPVEVSSTMGKCKCSSSKIF